MKKRVSPLWPTVLLTASCMVTTMPSLADEATEPLAVEEGYVEVDGGRIFYEVAGHGPPVVMIHDGLLHHETWDPQVDAFAKSYRVIRWDRRGYGRSDKPQAPFSPRDDLLAVMNALGVERATLMGCSSGGLLAIEFALDHPEMVSSLVLVGPIVSGFGFSQHFRTRGQRGEPGRDAPVEERIEYWSRKDPWIMAPESAAARERMRELLIANPQNMEGSGRYARRPDQPALGRLAEIHAPTLIVAGESDIPDVHVHIGAIQAGIGGSERVVLARSGHLCHLEVPDAFNKAVLDFLGKVK